MQKFRPYFTAPELLEVIKALKESPSYHTNKALVRYLETYAVKIDRGIIEPALVKAPSMEARLSGVNASAGATGEELYTKWETSPNSCTPAELEKVHLFRYSADLMTPEEATEFEKSQGINNGY
jgi:hypothetical protein